jgi:acyl-CoA thioester hydrolase
MKTPFHWPVRVYYEDTDAGGVVYHANYLKFFERARTERLRALGFEQDALRAEVGVIFAVKSAQIDYVKPARFNDALWVSAEVTESKRASFAFTQEMRRDSPEGELLCQATIRIVCLNDGELRPVAIPGFLLEHIKNDVL